RSDMNVPAGAKIQLLIKDANEKTKARLCDYGEIIQRMARIENIGFTDNVPKGSIQTIVDEAILLLPIANIIDIEQERTRLKKQLEKLEQNIKKIDQKLENKKFLSNAPNEVVEEQRSRKSTAEIMHEKLSHALEQLETV
ncbi:MAG: valine--tRNA ligase, partial [Alphaproteobacteria bacterium]|nr:valine--tRNA ligase [Alphaproteobacteria bacterium]